MGGVVVCDGVGDVVCDGVGDVKGCDGDVVVVVWRWFER